MKKQAGSGCIQLRGVRQNNLKHIDLDLPLGKLLVITGLSGSGKSSLAFDTLFAEGQRRYIETFSPYARQFFDRMDKPQADRIEGIPPAIAIEQRNAVRTTRSTVGTMTEICDYTKLIWPHLARLYCRQCGREVRQDTPRQIWETVGQDKPVLITFSLPLSDKLSLEETLDLIAKQGYQRLLLPALDASMSAQIIRLDEASDRLRATQLSSVTVVQDRLKPSPSNRARFMEACEQAYHFGKGKLTVYPLGDMPDTSSSLGPAQAFSNRFHCAFCDIEYREPTPALFSFNHPLGACPACHGFGRIISIDYNLAMPDRRKTLAAGVIKPWQSGVSAECQEDLLTYCRRRRVPTDVPFEELTSAHQQWVIEGDPGYGQDKQHEWPHAWYGVKGYFRWLESKAYKMHVRVLLSRYRAYTPCPECQGKRFQPEALWYRVAGFDPALSIADFYQMPIRDSYQVVKTLIARRPAKTPDPFQLALEEVYSRLGYLVEVGLGYLTLDRPTRSLSGGETERVNLTSCLGTRLVNTLFILDEPSVGLHARDTERLVRILEQLRDAGNTVIVVEHEAGIIRAADQIVDLGPGSGEAGGQVVFQGTFGRLLKSRTSLTGQYMKGTKAIAIPERRTVKPMCGIMQTGKTSGTLWKASLPVLGRADTSELGSKLALESPGASKSMNSAALVLSHASLHNIKDLTVHIPLERLVGITGVSGSGKTTLMRELLLPTLARTLQGNHQTTLSPEDEAENDSPETPDDPDTPGPLPCSIHGVEHLGRVILVDQSSLGKTPRSNPAVYSGAFADVREVFARSDLAQQRGLSASAFSFNSPQGQCEKCRGAGFEKIEMQFLSDVFIRCPECNGRRYRSHILEIKVAKGATNSAWSIADLLEATVDEVVLFLGSLADSKPAQRACQTLALLQQVGLGYLRLGQPINTLSGGESQRLKLVRHLAEFELKSNQDAKPTLFLFDEPTTGLHFDDVRVLLKVFQGLVEAGHSVVVIEHNLEVIKTADWLIDLGPEAGDQGGRIVVQGTPEQVAACPQSHTGQALLKTGCLKVNH